MSTREEQSIERLEGLVHRAIEEIQRLESASRDLKQQVADLESRGADAESWADEREQLTGRVQKLIDGLDEALSVADPG